MAQVSTLKSTGCGKVLRVTREFPHGRAPRPSTASARAGAVTFDSSLPGRTPLEKVKLLGKVSFELATDPRARDVPLPLSARVGIARELLVVLTEATRSGQRHLMCRVLEILQGDILRPTIRLTHSQVVAVMAAVTELQHEAARAAPDIALFCARARVVIDILSIA